MGSDDDDMTDDQLLAMPTEALPGDLSRLWAVRANATQNREFNEMIAELTGASSSHRMIFADQDPVVKRKREEEAARRAAQELQEYTDRSDRLLARIDEQERVLAKRRQEIEDKVIKLHDGRRVYIDGNNYRDENGRLLPASTATKPMPCTGATRRRRRGRTRRISTTATPRPNACAKRCCKTATPRAGEGTSPPPTTS